MKYLLAVFCICVSVIAGCDCGDRAGSPTPTPGSTPPPVIPGGHPSGGAITAIQPASLMGGNAGPITVNVNPIGTGNATTDGNPTDVFCFAGMPNTTITILQTTGAPANQPFPNPIAIPQGSYQKIVLMPDSIPPLEIFSYRLNIKINNAPFSAVHNGPNNTSQNIGLQLTNFGGFPSAAHVIVCDQSIAP